MRICFTGVGRTAGERVVFDLLPVASVPNGIQLADGGSVLDAGLYEVSLLLDPAAAPVRALMSINGGEPEELVHTKTSLLEGESGCAAFRMSLVDRWNPDKHESAAQYFKLTYGFARVEIELYVDGELEPLLLSTRDIPCRSKSPLDSVNVEAMLGELLDSDDVASRWMFGGAQGGPGRFSLMDGEVVERTAKSLASMLDLVERVLDEFDRQAGFFRGGAKSRIVHRRRMVPLGAVRKAGRDELIWLSRNTGVLAACPEREGMFYNGGWYLPRKVETSVRDRTFDSYENRLVLGFLAEVSRVTSLLQAVLDDAASEVRAIEERLRAIADESSVLPGLAIVHAYAEREQRFMDRLAGCAAHARILHRAYMAAMPDVQGSFGRNVQRTKTFTEVPAYLRLYTLMCEWIAFGDFSPVKEGMALQATKVDKLYEYFVLHRMLAWLGAHGFSPVGPEGAAIRCGAYEPEGFFKPETGVATVYELERLVRDGAVGAKLYYQPIIRSDTREEEGICLHRLSYNPGARSQNYWTPDYLIEVTDPAGKRSFHVIDAKYRSASGLFAGYPKHGELAECALKYRMDIMGAGDERVSSVWLVAGKIRERDLYYAESSPWATLSSVGARSGVAVLTMEIDRLDAMFAEVFGGILDVEGDRLESSGVTDATHVGFAGSVGDEGPSVGSDAHGDEGGDAGIALEAVQTPTHAAPPSDARDQVVSESDAPGGRRGRKRHKPKPRAAEKSGQPQPIASKAVKKANLPKSKPEKKRAKLRIFDLDDETRANVDFVLDNVEDAEMPFDDLWAKLNLGLERPLLRRRKPEGREAAFYEPFTFGREECWLNTHWTPVQKNRAKTLQKAMESKLETADAHAADTHVPVLPG